MKSNLNVSMQQAMYFNQHPHMNRPPSGNNFPNDQKGMQTNQPPPPQQHMNPSPQSKCPLLFFSTSIFFSFNTKILIFVSIIFL